MNRPVEVKYMVRGHALTEDNTPTQQREVCVLQFKFYFSEWRAKKSLPRTPVLANLEEDPFGNSEIVPARNVNC